MTEVDSFEMDDLNEFGNIQTMDESGLDDLLGRIGPELTRLSDLINSGKATDDDIAKHNRLVRVSTDIFKRRADMIRVEETPFTDDAGVTIEPVEEGGDPDSTEYDELNTYTYNDIVREIESVGDKLEALNKKEEEQGLSDQEKARKDGLTKRFYLLTEQEEARQPDWIDSDMNYIDKDFDGVRTLGTRVKIDKYAGNTITKLNRFIKNPINRDLVKFTCSFLSVTERGGKQRPRLNSEEGKHLLSNVTYVRSGTIREGNQGTYLLFGGVKVRKKEEDRGRSEKT